MPNKPLDKWLDWSWKEATWKYSCQDLEDWLEKYHPRIYQQLERANIRGCIESWELMERDYPELYEEWIEYRENI